MTQSSEFSKAVDHKLIKKRTDKRVSEAAGIEFVNYLTDYGKGIAQKAKKYADHAARKPFAKRTCGKLSKTTESKNR